MKFPKLLEFSEFGKEVNRMTNHQRNKWARAGYPGLRNHDRNKLLEFEIAQINTAGVGAAYSPTAKMALERVGQ